MPDLTKKTSPTHKHDIFNVLQDGIDILLCVALSVPQEDTHNNIQALQTSTTNCFNFKMSCFKAEHEYIVTL